MKVKSKGTKVAFLYRTSYSAQFRKKVRGSKKTADRNRLQMASIEREISKSSDDTLMGDDPPRNTVPDLFLFPPQIKDSLITESTDSQDEVVETCLPYLSGSNVHSTKLNSHNIPKLEREEHVSFLETTVLNARFTFLDASRPWVVYWCLTGLSILGENVRVYRERYTPNFASHLTS